MATITSAQSGNFGDTTTWVGGVIPVAADIAVAANGHTVQLNIDSVVTEYQQLGTGKYQLGSGRNISGLVRGVANTTAGTIEFVGTGTSTINGEINGGGTTTAFALLHNSTGTLNLNGNIVPNNSRVGGAVLMPSNGILNLNNSNISGGSGNLNHALGITGTNATVTISGASNITSPNAVGSPYAIVVSGANATLTINTTGTITGSSAIAGVETIRNAGANSVVTITGTCVGSLGPAINNASTGSVYVTGSVTAGTSHAIVNSSTGLLSVVGTLQASSTASAVVASAGNVALTGPFLLHSASGRHAVSSNIWRWTATVSNSTYYQVPTNNLLSTRNLYTADNITGMPAASNVKSGIAYGPSSELTGTFSQTVTPSTADIATAVWGAATRSITGGTVDTLTNAPTVPTASAIASQVRTELGTELGRIDAAISSRLAPSGTLATVTNLTNAPASVTPSDIWSHASRTITGGTVDTLTNAPTVPSASAIASQVRSELSVELARVDQNISSRLASSAYTAPANSDITAIKSKTDNLPASPAATGDIPSANITAIKAKTDLLNTDRLAQVSTVATTGAQLAAALS